MTDFAKDVARQIERRRARRKLIWWCAIAGLVVIAIVYLRCGRGWGIGTGTRTGTGVATPADARARCNVRVALDGTSLDGKPATREQIVAACRELGAADVVVTGGADDDAWKQLQAALDAVHVKMYVRAP